MKIMSWAVVLGVVSSFSSAIAAPPKGFTGRWVGSGFGQDDGGWSDECPSIVFEISQTDQSFTVKKASFKCRAIEVDWSPYTLEIREGGLWWGDRRLGEISETQFSYYASDDAGRVFSYQGTRKPGSARPTFQFKSDDLYNGRGMRLRGVLELK